VSVKVNVRYFLPHLTHDQDVVEVSGGTVGECLDELVNRFPELRKWVYDKNGDLTNFIDVYVNLERSMPEELSNPVKEGDELFIVMMLSGG
jgi:adenylyltransferase/sulfurtransferase